MGGNLYGYSAEPRDYSGLNRAVEGAFQGAAAVTGAYKEKKEAGIAEAEVRETKKAFIALATGNGIPIGRAAAAANAFFSVPSGMSAQDYRTHLLKVNSESRSWFDAELKEVDKKRERERYNSNFGEAAKTIERGRYVPGEPTTIAAAPGAVQDTGPQTAGGLGAAYAGGVAGANTAKSAPDEQRSSPMFGQGPWKPGLSYNAPKLQAAAGGSSGTEAAIPASQHFGWSALPRGGDEQRGATPEIKPSILSGDGGVAGLNTPEYTVDKKPAGGRTQYTNAEKAEMWVNLAGTGKIDKDQLTTAILGLTWNKDEANDQIKAQNLALKAIAEQAEKDRTYNLNVQRNDDANRRAADAEAGRNKRNKDNNDIRIKTAGMSRAPAPPNPQTEYLAANKQYNTALAKYRKLEGIISANGKYGVNGQGYKDMAIARKEILAAQEDIISASERLETASLNYPNANEHEHSIDYIKENYPTTITSMQPAQKVRFSRDEVYRFDDTKRNRLIEAIKKEHPGLKKITWQYAKTADTKKDKEAALFIKIMLEAKGRYQYNEKSKKWEKLSTTNIGPGN